MADVFFRGVPVNKAILVRHTPLNERNPTQKNNSGAIPISVGNLKAADDYISREGKYELKSDIDRALTMDDMNLRQDYHMEQNFSQGLDYIARMGDFETKGAERQLDATLWDAHGPVNRYQVEKEMLQAGGAYIDSIVTVSREHAHQLGLESKQDFQRFIRATWTDNCMEWHSRLQNDMMFKNRQDVRWVAAYHTDAQQSIHVHIHTWNAQGTILAHDTVSPLGTRLGKEKILQVGYNNIKMERNVRGDYLRNLQIAEVKHQLGMEITMDEKQRLELKAEKHGFEEKLSHTIDLSNEGKKQSQEILKELKVELEQGTGRIAENEKVQELATDLINCVEEHSPSVQELSRKNEDLFMVKAGFKGYLYNEEKDLKIKEWLEKELKGYIQSEKDELFTREKSKILKELLPNREPNIELRHDLQHLDCSKLEHAENISFSNKLTDYSINQKLGQENNQDIYVKTPLSSMANPQFVKLAVEDVGEINQGKAQLAKIELDKMYSIYNKEGEFLREIDGKKVLEFYNKADMPRIRKSNPEITPELLEREKKRELYKTRSKEHEQKIQDKMYHHIPHSQEQRIHDFSVKHGMSLNETKDFQYKMAKAAQAIEHSHNPNVDHLRNQQDVKIYLKLAAEAGIKGNVEQTIENRAQTMSQRNGWDINETRQLVTEVFVEQGSKELEKLLGEENNEFTLKEDAFELSQENQEQTMSLDSGLEYQAADLLASLAECGASGIGRGRRMTFRHEMDEQQRREYAHEHGMTLG